MTTTVLNRKTSEIKNKILDTSSLVSATGLNTKIGEVKNNIPNHMKYNSTEEFNQLTAEIFAAWLT